MQTERQERRKTRDKQESLGRLDWSAWPAYADSEDGIRNYWYPVMWSRKLGRRPKAITLLGERIMLKREAGTVYALNDRCPHRGVPLSHPMASQEFSGTWTCCYHGWTFDLATGELVAAITDGPDSPIRGKVAVRCYPVEERLGLIWVYVGDRPAPPVEQDIPSELLAEDALVVGRRTERGGDWRFGAENGFDEGHAKFLHRNSLWAFKRRMPTWNIHHVEERPERWITRMNDEVHYETEFPGLGIWPKRRWWKTPKQRTRRGVSTRLPGVLRVHFERYDHFEWWVPTERGDHIYLQMIVRPGSRLRRIGFWLYYWVWVRWAFHMMFNGQDTLMVDVMDAPPERLYRPDKSILAWRRLVEDDPRRKEADEGGVPRVAGSG